MNLNRGGGRQHHCLCLSRQLERPVVKKVFLRRLPHFGLAEIRAPDLVRLVPQDATELHFQQLFRQLAVELAPCRTEDHGGGNNGDLSRAVGDVVFGSGVVFTSLRQPAAAVPDGAGGGEHVHDLLLPLIYDGLGSDDENGIFVQSPDELSQSPELERLAEADSIREEIAGSATGNTVVAPMLVEGFFDEVFLVVPEAEQFRAGRDLGQQRRDLGLLLPGADMFDDGPLAETAHLLDDEFADGKAARP